MEGLPNTVLDTLVKLANLGAGGIAIFAIFWCGWLVSRPATAKVKEKQRTIQYYMVFCVAVLLVVFIISKFTAGDSKKKVTLLQNQIAQYQMKHKRYRVVGFVKKDDGSDPSNVTITRQFPPLIPNFSGEIIGLFVTRDDQDKFPSLSFSCPGYVTEGLNLDDQPITDDGVIQIEPVTLHKIPE